MVKDLKRLEDIVKQRKEEALEKDISGKAETIAGTIGRGIETKRYKSDLLRIKVGPDYHPLLVIRYEKQIVFKQRGKSIEIYVPGPDWESSLEETYTSALKISEERKREQHAKKELQKRRLEEKKAKKLRRNFGISDKPIKD